MAVAVRRDPRSIVDFRRGRDRAREVEVEAAGAVARPARERNVGQVRIDEIDVARIILREISLIAGLLIFET